MPSRSIATLLIGAAVLTCSHANAQARSAPTTESRRQAQLRSDSRDDPAQKLVELHTWLERLVGKFRATASFTGLNSPLTTNGGPTPPLDPPQVFLVDCSFVGHGKGVSCSYEATSRTVGELPLAMLLGVDLDRLEINILQVDANGYVRDGRGSLRGDTAVFDSECRAGNCVGRSTMRIYAPPRNRNVEIYIQADVRHAGSLRLHTSPMEARIELRR